MLRNTSNLQGHRIEALDGEIGRVEGFYFDDHSWTVRYLVVDTGGWLTGRRVLVAPEALGKPDWSSRRLPVSLTKKQIEESPGIGADKPVSRQQETYLRDYYGWPEYWPMTMTPDPWPTMPPVVPAVHEQTREREAGHSATRQHDPNLRSTREVAGYDIQALDGEIGHVEAFLVDDTDWVIRYLVVATRDWLPGKKVLVAVNWVETIDWGDGQVVVDLSRAQIKASPEYDPAVPLTRALESNLFDHYGRSGYWLV